MKKWLACFALIAVLFMGTARAEDVNAPADRAISITELLKKIPNLKQGVAYSFRESSFSYISTFDVAKWKMLSLEAGYSAGDKVVAVASMDLLKLKDLGVTLPILDLVEFRAGIYGGYGRVAVVETSGNNEWDWGASVSFINFKF